MSNSGEHRVVVMSAEQVRHETPWLRLIDALELAFRQPLHVPERVHMDVAGAGSLLIMPAWQADGFLGVKVVQVFPRNSSIGKPALNGIYMLSSAVTGEVHAYIDAQELTARRTAAASALASKFLSRPNSRCQLVMGTGRLAFEVIAAHSQVRPIDRVLIWGRQQNKAISLAQRVSKQLNLQAAPVGDLPAALAQADIVSTVTAAFEPILPGQHIRPGTHIDLIGGFTPLMREADDATMQRATLFVDSLAVAQREAGDIADPLARGIIAREDICGDLFDLCNGRIAGRRRESEITLFKSVGIALEDFAAATLAWNSLKSHDAPRRANP